MIRTLALTAFMACGLSLSANAQETENNLKSVAGNKTLETNLYFGWGNSANLKLRRFTTDTNVLRYETSISYHTSNFQDKDGKSNNLTISYIPGLEKHFTGTDRLSPYIGLSLPLTLKLANYDSPTLEVKGASDPWGNDRGYFDVGLNGLAGADLYVVKNFYVGFEVGAGFYFTKHTEAEANYKNDFTRNQKWEGYNSLGFRTFTTGGIRVGFAF